MVNIIFTIIIAGSLGFLAGHFFTAGNPDSPLTAKEAVTGDIEPAPATYSIPRPSTSTSKPSAPVPPVMCEQGSTLQEQMMRLKFGELQKLCNEAERDWQVRNVDSFAPDSKDPVERDRARAAILQTLKEPMMTSAYWRGEGTLNDGNRSIQVEIFVNWYKSKDGEEAQSQRATLSLNDPMELCFNVSPYFMIDGKPNEQAGSTMGQCGATLRKRGDTFYIHWNTFNDRELSPFLSVLLIPIPGSRQTALEYLHGEKAQWISEAGFRWQPSSFQETANLRERYHKKLEERSR